MARKKNPPSKTLAMKVLEGQNIPYQVITFPDTIHDAKQVAAFAAVPAEMVYKTLVVIHEEPRSKPMLILVAADRELDLKLFAKAIDVKKVRMAKHKEAESLTGLQVGGISPLALLNQGFAIYADAWIDLQEEVLVSAGQRGLNLRLTVPSLLSTIGASLIEASESLHPE